MFALSIRFLFFVFVYLCFSPVYYHVHEHCRASLDATSGYFLSALTTNKKFFARWLGKKITVLVQESPIPTTKLIS